MWFEILISCSLIFLTLALIGISGSIKTLEEKIGKKSYTDGIEDGISMMIKLYDVTGAQTCDLVEKVKSGCILEIQEESTDGKYIS